MSQETDILEQARAVREVRDLADSVLGDLVRAANDSGWTWRDIAVSLEVPFQTLYSRYGSQQKGSRT